MNALTVKDNYPMPLIEERLESLKGKGIFTSLDLTSGYWQFALEPSSRILTAFISHEGVFEFTRMPFGLCNAGATFQRAMELMLRDIDCAMAYIDDIMTSSANFETHMNDLRKVFNAIRKHKLKIKGRKCVFGARETKFLGFLVSKDGIRVCPSRSDCIRNYPQPQSAKNIKEFLGLASYYRKFIQGFAHIAAPLTRLTQKGTPFVWSVDCETSFRKLIERLLNPPVLRFPDFNVRFKLSTDASNAGLGAVLFQTNKDGDEQVIAYASRGLTGAEHNYNTTEKELLAIVLAIDRFRPYLYGVEFDLITDHKPLTYMTDLNLGSARITRWKMRLQEYSINIIHKAGKDHCNADTLSRIVESMCAISDEAEVLDGEKIRKLQETDAEISRLRTRILAGEAIKNFKVVDGILFCKLSSTKSYDPDGQYRLVVPQGLIGDVLQTCHDDIGGE